MKKIVTIFICFILCLSFVGCGVTDERFIFERGNLLYDLGATSLDDIENVEIFDNEWEDWKEKCEITQMKDIQLLGHYTYYSDYEGSISELFKWQVDSIYVTVGDAQYKLFLNDDYSITIVWSDDTHHFPTYKATNGNGITVKDWKRFILKYK